MNIRMSSHALPDWKIEHRFIFNCDAYYHMRRSQKFRPLFADLEAETLYAFYHKNYYFLIAKFLLQYSG